jgi:hypothetical protein
MKRIKNFRIQIFLLNIFLMAFSFGMNAKSDLFSAGRLSDSSRISLLTVAPGEDLYSAFGHTGIRVTDCKNNFDLVYNYGTYDFEQPGFYKNFVKGKMQYMISANRFEDFQMVYDREKRGITEQTLNLGADDRQNIYAFLDNNALPENKYYLYDFFWDNCATRPRDVFEKTLGDRLQYNTEHAGFQENKTLHDMLRIYIGNRPWVDYGFDLILGMPCEIIASPRDQTFLPDYLSKYIGSATLDGKAFASNPEQLSVFPITQPETGFRPLHFNLILLFLGVIIWLLERKRKTYFYFFDFLLFLLIGLLGTFFLGLWLFTSHYSVPENFNLLWLIPFHLIVAFFLLKRNKPVWLNYYFTGTAILMLFLIISWKWLPQQFNIAVMPLLLLLAGRSVQIAGQLHNRH